MKYASPAAFKAALEQRLRDRAAGASAELQRVRQLLVYDRFLARLFANDATVVLKGGLVLELRLERARTTKDVDLRMLGDADSVLLRLQAAGRADLGDHLQFLVTPDPHHPVLDAEGMLYEGRRFRVEPRLAGKVYARPFGVDVAVAEPVEGTPDVVAGEPWLEFVDIPPARFRVYPLEAHVAEKLHAYTMPRSRPNSRVKDLPDLGLLAQVRPVPAADLTRAIARTFSHRSVHAVPTQLPDPPDWWAAPYAEMARADQLPWPTLPDAFAAARRFLDPVLAGATGTWDPASSTWT